MVPPGAWTTAAAGGVTVIADDGLSPEDAGRRSTASITRAALAIAETGTIILDGSPGPGPARALSLVPDYHLCIVHAKPGRRHLVPRRWRGSRPPAGRCTWISGPSATSDIELDRVEGVHGPRTLEVILVESLLRDAPSGPGYP